jgi:hypothetical protein
VIISAAVPPDHPLRASATSLCWVCGRAFGAARYSALDGAPWVLRLHTGCILPLARRLVAEWRAALAAAEIEA